MPISEVFSIAATAHHFADPFQLTQKEKEHLDPEFWDRFGGVILLILSIPLVVPACLYLYWASKKVEKIDKDECAKNVEDFAKTHPVFEKKRSQPTTKPVKSSRKLKRSSFCF